MKISRFEFNIAFKVAKEYMTQENCADRMPSIAGFKQWCKDNIQRMDIRRKAGK